MGLNQTEFGLVVSEFGFNTTVTTELNTTTYILSETTKSAESSKFFPIPTNEELERIHNVYSGYINYLLSIYVIIIIPSVIGNALILLSLIRFRRLRSRINILIGNLAISDLLLGLVFVPYDIAFLNLKSLQENKSTCLLRHSMNLILLDASVLNLFCISFERYIAIVHPFKHVKICRKRYLFILMCSCWSFAVIFGSIPLMGWNMWHPGIYCDNELIWHETYRGVEYITICTCIIANFVMYIKVMVTAWNQLKNTNSVSRSTYEPDSQRHAPAVTKKDVRKTKIMVLVLGIFAFCWGPYCIIVIIETFFFDKNVTVIIIKKFLGCLGMLNSGLNWIVYGAKNKNFRRAFKYFLTCTKCGQKKRFSLSTTK